MAPIIELVPLAHLLVKHHLLPLGPQTGLGRLVAVEYLGLVALEQPYHRPLEVLVVHLLEEQEVHQLE